LDLIHQIIAECRRLLRKLTQGPLPHTVEERLSAWERRFGALGVRPAVLLEAGTEAEAEEAETTSAAATAGKPATEEAEAGPVAEETTTEEGPATDADKAPTRRRGRKASSEDEEA